MSIDHTEIEWQFDVSDLGVVRHWLTEHASSDGLESRQTEVRQQVDTYCDTADWRVYRAGYALRVRRVGSQAEVTLKSLVPGGQGARHRREISEDLNDVNPESSAVELLRHAPGDAGRRVAALVGTHPIRRLFELHTQREIYNLQIDGAPAGDIALDETRIVARPRGKEAHLRRVEVEVQDDTPSRLKQFVDEMRTDCELRPAMATKFESGLLAQRLVPDPPPHFGATSVGKSPTLGDLALSVMRKQYAEFLAHEPGVRLDEDPEELHQMRLSARRMRAALRIFAQALPTEITDLTEDMKWMGALLGAARDIDVQVEWLSKSAGQAQSPRQEEASPQADAPQEAVAQPAPEPSPVPELVGESQGAQAEHVQTSTNGSQNILPAQAGDGEGESVSEGEGEGEGRGEPEDQVNSVAHETISEAAMQPVKALLDAKRESAHKSLMHGLDSPRYERFKANLAAQLRRPSKWPAKADRKARKVVPELLQRYYRRARKQGDALDASAPPADYHQVRIKFKNVRYSLEFIKGLYGKPAKRMLKRVEELVDVLGEYHDMQVAIQLYRDWRTAPPEGLPEEALTALDTLAWRSNAHADELKAQFPDLYAQVTGKDWKRLRSEMA